MIGGTSRDFLLNREFTDFDLCTDATPNEEMEFLDEVDDSFKKYGTLKVKYLGNKFEITTLRKESSYNDKRHPSEITFIKEIKEDFKRRDFTVNALYIDREKNIYDFSSGRIDLNGNLLRIIGNPDIRLKEDPLRIIRAIRFSLELDFEIEESLIYSMKRNAYLVASLNQDKVNQEIKKALSANVDERALRVEFKKYNLTFPKI